MLLVSRLLVFYLLLFSNIVPANDLAHPDQNLTEVSFYYWLTSTHVMNANSLSNRHLANINNAYVSSERIINATPLIKFYADKLISEGVPSDFAILPLVESGNNPQAKSPMNAMGLWQFIPSTGRDFGLHHNTIHDERTDVNKSTIAAARYLRGLYNRYHDWNLVLAAYNWGPGSVDRALSKGLKQPNGQINLEYLPQETRNYLIYFYSFNRQIDLNYKNPNMSKFPNVPYLVEIESRDFNKYLSSSKFLKNMSVALFRQVNGFEPELMNTIKGVVLVPTEIFSRFFSTEKISFKSDKLNNKKNEIADLSCQQGHLARYGESLESIAKSHHIKVDKLIDLNPSVRFIRPGMIINICN